MWVLRKSTASKLSLRRRVSLLVIAVILAAFAIVGPLMKRAVAAGDTGTWSGSTLTYNGDKYTSTTAAPKYKDMTTAYQFINTSPNPNIAFVMYFKGDAKDAQTATSAVLLQYIYTSPDKYSDPSPPADVTITPAGQDPSKNTSTAGSAANSSSTQSSCNAQYFGGVGWIVCSVSTWIANGVDGIYDLIKQFLEVDTITQSNNGVFQIWQMVLGVANVAFIIIFLIIVYSQLTSIGISNYSIKDMIPRLIIAAILVNFSFWICQLFVDISNVLGYSIEALFMHVTDQLGIKVDIPWADLTTVILSGGTIATGTLAFAAVAGGSFASLGFILLGALISAGLAVLVAFVILAARQALIVVFVMLAPLAFVAMVLPSTKELFEKWRKAFQTLLLFFPIFAVLFGGSQLAGAAIIKSQEGQPNDVNHIAVILIGLAVQVIPLFITPLILQFSSGLLGRIAGIANDRKRGLVDRAKNWTQSNADDFKMRKLANAADRREMQRPNETRLARALRQGRPSNLGLALDQSKRTRERRTKRNSETLENRSLSTETARINDPSTAGFGTRGFYDRQRQRQITSHSYHETAKLHQAQIDADGERHWAEHVDQTPYLRNIQRQTALTTGVANTIAEHNKSQDEVAVGAMIRANSHLQARAIDTGINKKLTADYQAAIDAASEEGHLKIQRANPTYRSIRTETNLTKKRAADIDAGLSAIEQRTYETLVDEARTPQYQQIREIKRQTTVDTKHAQDLAARLEAEGEREYNRAFEDGVTTTFTDANGNTRQIRSRDLQQQNNATEQLKKESSSIQNTLQKRADAHWAEISRNDERIQGIRLTEESANQSAKLTEERWNEFIENVHEDGADAAGVFVNNAFSAAAIQRDHAAAEQVEHAVKKIKDISHSNSEREFIESAQGRELDARARQASGEKDIVQDAVEREWIKSDEGKRLNEDLQAASAELDASKTAEQARIEEMKTKKGAEGLTDPDSIAAAERLHAANTVKRAQERRSAAAGTVATEEYAGEVRNGGTITNPDGTTEEVAKVAAGILGARGESQAKAAATETMFDAFNKTVAAEKTLVSRNEPSEILGVYINDPADPDYGKYIIPDANDPDNIAKRTVALNDPNILDEPAERIAALAGAIAGGGHHASRMKLWRRMSAIRKGAEKELKSATLSGDQARIDAAKEKVDKAKNIEQQVISDGSQVPFGVGSQARGKAKSGNYTDDPYDGHYDRIMSDLEPKTMASMDPDDLRLTFEMARAGKLDKDHMKMVVDTYEAWKTDDLYKGSLKKKQSELLDQIKAAYEGEPNPYKQPKDGGKWVDHFDDVRSWNPPVNNS